MFDFLLGGNTSDPARTLDTLARLEFLVDADEVLDRQPQELRDVVDVAKVFYPRVRR
jgi:hypothetical protein